MSDDHPLHVSGAAHSVEAVSLEEQMAWADAHRDGRPVVRSDAIATLHQQCTEVIAASNLNHHHRMMAAAKLEELFFWIRAGMQREGQT